MLPPGWGVRGGGGERGQVPKIQPRGDPPATGGGGSGRSRGVESTRPGDAQPPVAVRLPLPKHGSLSHAAPALAPPPRLA